MREKTLFGWHSGSLVPREIRAVILDPRYFRLRFLDEPLPTVSFAVVDRLLFVEEIQFEIWVRVAGRRPSHQRILPAFPRFEFHPPSMSVIRSRLHRVSRRHEDPHPARRNMLFRYARYRLDPSRFIDIDVHLAKRSPSFEFFWIDRILGFHQFTIRTFRINFADRVILFYVMNGRYTNRATRTSWHPTPLPR